jgi:chromosome segregation ATPase
MRDNVEEVSECTNKLLSIERGNANINNDIQNIKENIIKAQNDIEQTRANLETNKEQLEHVKTRKEKLKNDMGILRIKKDDFQKKKLNYQRWLRDYQFRDRSREEAKDNDRIASKLMSR